MSKHNSTNQQNDRANRIYGILRQLAERDQVFMESGTTVIAFSPSLVRNRIGIRAVTNAADFALPFIPGHHFTYILLGGMLQIEPLAFADSSDRLDTKHFFGTRAQAFLQQH